MSNEKSSSSPAKDAKAKAPTSFIEVLGGASAPQGPQSDVSDANLAELNREGEAEAARIRREQGEPVKSESLI